MDSSGVRPHLAANLGLGGQAYDWRAQEEMLAFEQWFVPSEALYPDREIGGQTASETPAIARKEESAEPILTSQRSNAPAEMRTFQTSEQAFTQSFRIGQSDKSNSPSGSPAGLIETSQLQRRYGIPAQVARLRETATPSAERVQARYAACVVVDSEVEIYVRDCGSSELGLMSALRQLVQYLHENHLQLRKLLVNGKSRSLDAAATSAEQLGRAASILGEHNGR